MKSYIEIADAIVKYGKKKPSRPGINTLSLVGPQFRHDMADGFPLLTTKEVNFKAVLHELLWFLRAEEDVSYLHEQGVHIWDHWADEEGYVGPIYGCQWRLWPGIKESWDTIDQLHDVISRLCFNPYDRRLLVSAWNPGHIPYMALPPCHVMFQLIHDGDRLNLHMYQRSADWMLGVPFNIASYALLLSMICHITDHEPGELVISYGDAHIYENHLDKYGWQAEREPRALPSLWLKPDLKSIDAFLPHDIKIKRYNPWPAIKFPVAV